MGRKKRKTEVTEEEEAPPPAADNEVSSSVPSEDVVIPFQKEQTTKNEPEKVPAASNYAMKSHSGEIIQEGTLNVTLTLSETATHRNALR